MFLTLHKYSIFSFYFLCLGLQISNECNGHTINTLELERPGKNLCVNYQDVDCSNQITPISKTENTLCLMKFFNRTSKECSDEEFQGQLGTTDQFGTFSLTPFQWFDTGISFPALNVTFSHIQWRRLRMRFLRVGSETPQLCREFVLSSAVVSGSVLSFDCLWGGGTAAGQNYRFQYIITAEDGSKHFHSYLVRIPRDEEISNGTSVLMMLDETQFPQVSARLQTPQSSVTAYVTLYHRQDADSAPEQLAAWTANTTGRDQVVTVGSYDTGSTVGFYYYNASLLTGELTLTPTLQVKGVGVIWRAVLATLVIVVFILGVVLFLWKNQYKEIINDQEKLQNVLLVYESCYPSHVDDVRKFKEFLEDHCFVSTKLDIDEIPKSDSMSPRQWYRTTFETLDYVLLLASPDESTAKGVHEDVVYTDNFSCAIQLLQARELHPPKLRIATVKLPGCSWKSLPREVDFIGKRFSLPEKLKRFLQFLNSRPLMNGSSIFIEAMKRTRVAPKLHVSLPIHPLPIDAQECEPKSLLTVGSQVLRLNGEGSSEEEDDDDNEDGSQVLRLNSEKSSEEEEEDENDEETDFRMMKKSQLQIATLNL